MNDNNFESLIKKHVHRIAPEADLEQLDPAADLGPALDIDSMDFYNMMVALSEELHIDIPEEEYGRLRTLNDIETFLKDTAERQP